LYEPHTPRIEAEPISLSERERRDLEVDAGFPNNSALTIDPDGTPI